MTHEEILISEMQDVICMIIDHIRPDGEFRNFTYNEREYLEQKMNKWVKENKQ